MIDVTTYINTDVMILIPVIYVIGFLLKMYVTKLDNKYIPLILFFISIISTCLVLKEISVNSIIQGILLSSVTVFANQLWKQLLSGEKSNKTEEIINEDKKDN